MRPPSVMDYLEIFRGPRVELQDWSHRIASLKRLGAETSYPMWIFAGITWSLEFQE